MAGKNGRESIAIHFTLTLEAALTLLVGRSTLIWKSLQGIVVLGQTFRTDSQDRLLGQTFRTDFQDRLSGQTFRTDFQDRLSGQTFRTDFQDRLSGQTISHQVQDNGKYNQDLHFYVLRSHHIFLQWFTLKLALNI